MYLRNLFLSLKGFLRQRLTDSQLLPFIENRLNKLKAPGPPQPPTNEVDMDAAGMRR